MLIGEDCQRERGGPLLPPAKSKVVILAGGVIGVKQTVFNTQELELPRSFRDVGF